MLTASSTANNRVLIYRKYGLEHIICLEKTKLKDSDKSLCLDLTLAVHRWVHAEVKGKIREKRRYNQPKQKSAIVYSDI